MRRLVDAPSAELESVRLFIRGSFIQATLLPPAISNLTAGEYNENTDIGPLSSIDARDEIVERLEKAEKDGTATIAVGGKAIDRPGAYMDATLLTDVDRSSDVGCNEIFGPVAIVYKASSPEDAVEIANEADYGLSGCVWGHDLDKAEEVAQQLEVGMAFVNESSVTAAGLPFGGVGRSGYGRELERWGVGEFVNDKLYRVREQDGTAGLSPAL